MNQDVIHIVGACQNNLKNISIDIPKHKWVTFTGVSGSGKSTLVFDLIYARAEKEFLESLSAYARRSFPKVGEVDVQEIEGLSPCIVIDQSSFPNTPRSTVGTYTDIYTYLRLLFSRAGDQVMSSADFSFNNAQGACPVCNGLGEALTPEIDKLLDRSKSLNEGAIRHKTWKVNSRYWNIIRAIGYFDMDKKVADFTDEEMDKLLNSGPVIYQNNEPGHVQSFSYEGIVSRMKKRKSDSRGLSAAEYDSQFFTNGVCPECGGARLNQRALSVKIGGKYTIADCVNMEIKELYEMLSELHGPVEDALCPVIRKALKNLIDVGMGYISLNRSAFTLSGGEAQKVKLAKALGCSLRDMIYILDEPTSGLHARDIYKIRNIIRDLVDKGNTVLVIEHNREMVNASDVVIDMGPGAGKNGGKILFNGPREELERCTVSLTAEYLKKGGTPVKLMPRKAKGSISLKNIHSHNVHHLDLSIPKGIFTCITGVSGAGKSTVLEVLVKEVPKAIVVDQDEIGATNRGNAATYTKAFDAIRQYFSEVTGYDAADFSFNSKGSCPACNGAGYTVTDMHFIGDIKTPCEICGGKRYRPEILSLKVKGKNISDVLDMTVEEAMEFFRGQSEIYSKLEVLEAVGLEYLTLGQPLSTLSGGELQRLKLADRLKNRSQVYIFDEPTHGLHFKDTEKLVGVMNKLVDTGNTVIVVEHNLDIIAQADWIIDMGPEGGKEGGKIIFEGPTAKIIESKESYTGQFLLQQSGQMSNLESL